MTMYADTATQTGPRGLWRRLSLAAATASCVFWLGACSDNESKTTASTEPSAPTNSTPTSITAPDQSAVVNVTVTLPAGTPQALATLSLNNSIGAVSVGPGGTFALPVFAGGPQYADVLDTKGTAVALGFVSPTATTIDATSTAKVLIYFAAGFYALPLPARVDIVDQISTEDGFNDVVKAVTSAMVAGGIGSATGGPMVTSALQTFVAALYAPANATPAAVTAQKFTARAKDVLVQPSTLQSGITVINDYPDGVHFMNKYRRLATAYIDKVSTTDAQGNVSPDPETDFVKPVQIPNTSGLGNVTSVAIDAARVLAGASGDYNPVETSTVALPLDAGTAKTTYNVTVVGPAVHFGTVAMTQEQSDQQRKLVLQQLLQNYVVPLTCSVIVPIASKQIDAFFAFDGGNTAVADLINNLGVAAPQLYDLMAQGNVGDAMTATFNAFAQSNVLQAALLQVVYEAIDYAKGAGVADAAAQRGQTLLLYLNVLSGVFVTYDVGVLTTQLALSNRADVFTVDVIAPKVTLTPQTATIPVTSSQTFKAAVPAASDSGQLVVYHWSNTANNGHLTDGINDHMDDFDSSSATVTYTPNSNGLGNDTILVIAYQVNNSQRINLGTVTSTVTVQNATIPVGISPQDPQVPQATLRNFAVQSSNGASFASGTTFQWVLTAGNNLFGAPRDLGGSGGGTIGVNISVPASSGASTGTSKTVVTTSPAVTFAANPFGPEANGPDFSWINYLQLTVSIMDPNGTVLESASTKIQTQISTDILLP